MNINDIIKTRRAIYPSQYEKGEVKKSFIKLLLENANTAPSHRLTQPWFFKVYRGLSKDKLAKEMIKSYDQLNNENSTEIKKNKIIEKCKKSNCIISVFMKRDSKKSVPEWEEIAATAMAMQNMWLTCTAYNIGCYWSTPKYSVKMNDFFKLKNDERCLGFFYLGEYYNVKVKSKKEYQLKKKLNGIINYYEITY